MPTSNTSVLQAVPKTLDSCLGEKEEIVLFNSTDDPELEKEFMHYAADSLMKGFKRVPQGEWNTMKTSRLKRFSNTSSGLKGSWHLCHWKRQWSPQLARKRILPRTRITQSLRWEPRPTDTLTPACWDPTGDPGNPRPDFWSTKSAR